jgi:hypothetical protein
MPTRSGPSAGIPPLQTVELLALITANRFVPPPGAASERPASAAAGRRAGRKRREVVDCTCGVFHPNPEADEVADYQGLWCGLERWGTVTRGLGVQRSS